MVMVLGAFALLLPSALIPSLRADEGKSPSAAKKELPRSRPEQQGISSAAILAFVEEADKKIENMNSFMLVRHGNVVAEGWWAPYGAKTPHELYSLSKSFTSTAVGLAIADGKLSLDDPVLKFFPDDAPSDPSNYLKAMRVRDLLCMSTGHQTEPRLAGGAQAWVKTFLTHPVPNKPGTHFLYNTAATYMQSAIVQKVTGKTVLEYLQPRLFEPLGIESPTWGTSPQGVTLGGYGLNIRTEDIARFGQLYLQKGKWNGQQLVPAAWTEAATSKQTSNGSNPLSDWDQGYGYQFWRCRHNAYRGDGAFGQYCIVMPEQDAVVAITSGVKDMQAVMNLVWDKLLPAMKADTLSADEEATNKLQAKLASLMMPVQKGLVSVQMPKEASGKHFTFSANDQKLEQLGLEFGSDGNPATLIAKFKDSAEQRIPCGNNEWKKSRLAFAGLPEQNAAISGAWTADNTYTAKVCLYETPFVITLKLDFSKDLLRFDSAQNVSFGPVKKPQLVGERK
jgi:CubicO group peptidase (beta-lactamase class C family)